MVQINQAIRFVKIEIRGTFRVIYKNRLDGSIMLRTIHVRLHEFIFIDDDIKHRRTLKERRA